MTKNTFDKLTHHPTIKQQNDFSSMSVASQSNTIKKLNEKTDVYIGHFLDNLLDCMDFMYQQIFISDVKSCFSRMGHFASRFDSR